MNANQMCVCGDCLDCRPDLFPIKPNQCVVCGCYNLSAFKKVGKKLIHCLDCYRQVTNAKRRQQRKQKKELCKCCGKKHDIDECEGVNCGACNDHDYHPLTFLAGVMRCSFCVDDYNNYTCEVCGEYEYEEVGLSTGENGIEKRVCSRCDIDGCDYNGWDAKEDDSEYMCELIECRRCEIEKPRKNMYWDTIGSYTNVCKDCEHEAEIRRQEFLNRPPQEKIQCVVCEEQKATYSIGVKCKTCKNSMCQVCCCEYHISNPGKFNCEGDETGYAVDIYIPCPICRTINSFGV